MRTLLLLVLLAGCATTKPEPTMIPYRVPCVDAKDVPAEVPPVTELPEGSGAADILAATILKLRATDRELRALISGCTR